MFYGAARNRMGVPQGYLDQWWRTYGTRVRGGTHSPHCGHAHYRSSAELVIRKVEGREARLIQVRDNHLK